jgi:hypothetical protein
MKRNIFLLTLVIVFISFANAQDNTVKNLQAAGTKEVKSLDSNGWKKSGNFILNINQGALSNWAAGGEQSVFGINGILNYAINYRQDKNTWDNYFDLALGIQNASSFSKFRKIDDRIDITSKYGYKINKKWFAGLLFNFNSQAIAGYDYSTTPNTKISSFLTPGKILLSPGFDYRPSDKFSLFFSPVTVRWVLKNNADFYRISKFGVDAFKKSNSEIGAYLTARYTVPLNKWATYTSRLDLFSNYKRKPQNIDLLMNNLLTMKFTKNLATTLTFDMIYDDDVIKRLQIKEILGIGLTLKL